MRNKTTIENKLNEYLETLLSELENENMDSDGVVFLHKLPFSDAIGDEYMIHFSLNVNDENIEVIDSLNKFERKLKTDEKLLEGNEEFKNKSYKYNVEGIKKALKNGCGKTMFGSFCCRTELCKVSYYNVEKSIQTLAEAYNLYRKSLKECNISLDAENFNKFKPFAFEINGLKLIDIYTVIYKLL